jgi:hypothetical protein
MLPESIAFCDPQKREAKTAGDMQAATAFDGRAKAVFRRRLRKATFGSGRLPSAFQ